MRGYRFSKTLLSFFLLVPFISLISCNDISSQRVSAEDFYTKLIDDNSSIIIDVRTPEEFSKGHLRNALNINWFDENFESQVEILSRERPVFIYCLSGGRSAKALDKISEMGFKNSYELNGGILEWRKNNYPESIIKVDYEKSLSVNEFSKLITSDKIVMVDYFAKWCAPCKVMEPFLDDLSKKYSDKLKFIRIDYDQNLPLVKSLGVQGLPVIQIYYDNQLLWSQDGFSDKNTIETQIKKYL
ncbi:MAG: thioredoxin domain-containing protein [Bacteroidota bacterium]|jgi:thioredoxin|nr:thioredoxin domain-containing protein [Bacteroidota bacterium]|tara:strand:+ start:905 stop:1633 length:729 start_codon:yes stop_codon:yes gene_type:complete